MIITTGPATRWSPWLRRLALPWVGFVLLWAAVGVFRNLVLLPSGLPYDAVQVVQALLTAVLVVPFVLLLCRRVDHRSPAALGLGATRQDRRAFGLGALLWLGFAVLAVVVALALQAFPVEVRTPSAALVGALLLRILLVFAFEALPEELALRGYVLTTLRERLPTWLAVLAQAVLFTLWAYAFSTLIDLFGFRTSWEISVERTVLFLTFGVTLALVRIWTGSLWGSIGFHLAYQTVVQLIGVDRFVLAVPAGYDQETALVFLWFFPVVLGGLVAFLGVVSVGRGRAGRHRRAHSSSSS